MKPIAVIRGPVLERQPAIVDLMQPVFAGLDLATLRRLNERVAVDGENAQAVAAGYLSRKSG